MSDDPGLLGVGVTLGLFLLGWVMFFYLYGGYGGRVQGCSHRVMSHAQEIAPEKSLSKNYFQPIELSYKDL